MLKGQQILAMVASVSEMQERSLPSPCQLCGPSLDVIFCSVPRNVNFSWLALAVPSSGSSPQLSQARWLLCAQASSGKDIKVR